MKLSEFKKLIRQSVMEEMNEDQNISNADSYYGFLSEEPIDENVPNKDTVQRKYNEMFGKNPNTKISDVAKALGTSEENATMALMGIDFSQMKLEEAEEEEEITDTEVDITEPAPEAPDMGAGDMTSFAGEPTYTPEEAEVMDSLDNALKQAQDLGDEKLSTLIGNIITYFTRQHVVKEGSAGRKKHYRGAVKDDKDQISKLKKDMKFDKKQLQKESLEILKMKKLAGLLKEGEYAKALLRENNSGIDLLMAKLKKMSPQEFTNFVKKVGDYNLWRNFPKGIDPFNNISDRMEVISTFEDEDVNKYLNTLRSNKGQRLREEDSDVYMSFDKEKWFDKEDKPYAGDFDFDYDEETFDDFDSFMSKYGDKQISFRPSDKSIFDTYKNKYNNMMMRKRK
jgi:hypothetical protein